MGGAFHCREIGRHIETGKFSCNHRRHVETGLAIGGCGDDRIAEASSEHCKVVRSELVALAADRWADNSSDVSTGHHAQERPQCRLEYAEVGATPAGVGQTERTLGSEERDRHTVCNLDCTDRISGAADDSVGSRAGVCPGLIDDDHTVAVHLTKPAPWQRSDRLLLGIEQVRFLLCGQVRQRGVGHGEDASHCSRLATNTRRRQVICTQHSPSGDRSTDSGGW